MPGGKRTTSGASPPPKLVMRASKPLTTFSKVPLRPYSPSTPVSIKMRRAKSSSRKSQTLHMSPCQSLVETVDEQQIRRVGEYAVVVDHDRRRHGVAQVAAEAERRVVLVGH